MKSNTSSEIKKIFAPKKVKSPTNQLGLKKDRNSINEIKSDIQARNQTKVQPEEDLFEKPSDPYTPEKFEKVWKASMQRLKDNHNQTLYAAFLAHKPKLEKPFMIHVFLENHIQVQDFEQQKTDLLSFTRKELNNWKVQMKASLVDGEIVEEKGKQYDNREKFKKWVEKNPGLMELKKKFNLDIDL